MIDQEKVELAISRISSDRIVAADPLSALSDAMVEATAAVGEDTVAAMALLRVYAPAVSIEVISLVESMRLRMTPGALGQLEKLGNSLSMRELLQRVTMNIGGGG